MGLGSDSANIKRVGLILRFSAARFKLDWATGWQVKSHKTLFFTLLRISIHNLNAFEQTQGDLFSEDEQTRQKQEKRNNLTKTMDNIVSKYGNKAVSLGVWEEPPGGYAGAKIAFGRIPDLSDF